MMNSLCKIILFVILILTLNVQYSIGQDSLKKTESKSETSSFFSVQGTYVRHLGNFGNVWSHTTGIYAIYGIQYPSNYILNFKTGYLTLHNKKNINFPENSGSTIIPFIVGGKYFFNLGIIKPYFSFNNGVNIIFQKFNLNGESEEKTMQKYYWQAGMGTYIDLHKNLKLDLSVNINSHFYEDDAMMTGFEYMIGLQY
jgi:hypothetical protein